MTANSLSNINQYQSVAPKNIVQAVQNASARTGADFSFLMEKASAESSFNPSAKAKTSSATGLYQFIDSTWLATVKKHGAQYGLGEYADKISMKGGKACVANSCAKKEILELRKNPEVAALMAGAFSNENKAYLESHVKSDIGGTELYLAHFMGASGAAKFINARDYDGGVSAASLFPKAAAANPSIFYNRQTGAARSLDDIYRTFSRKFTGDPASPPAHAPVTVALDASDAACAVSSAPEDLAVLAQTLPLSPETVPAYGFAPHRPSSMAGPGFQSLSPAMILMLAEYKNQLPV